MAFGDEFELRAIREEQARLQSELKRLERRIQALEPAARKAPPPAPVPPPIELAKPEPPAEPPPLPLADPRPVPTMDSMDHAEPIPSIPSPADPPARGSFELEFGAVWLARIGIVVLITGLVFLGNYARQIIVPHLGPGGKLALLYLLSGLLAGAGAWLRARQEVLRLYSQVLTAGGGALAYYSTYAAYYVAPLRVIGSPLIGGACLLACGGLLLWVAERRRWELAALLTILLSYYTAGINPIGDFTLYSNLLLTAAGVWLLFRHRWVRLSWMSLGGTYGSFAYWQWFRYAATTGLRAEEPWTLGFLFLTGYWLLFTAAVFFAGRALFPPARRVAFLTLNNAAFWFLGTVQWLDGPRREQLWVLYLVFGLAQLALAAAAWRRRPDEPEVDGAYLVQGVVLVTAGFAQKLTDLSLALTCAVESLVLLTGVGARHGRLFLVLGAGIGFFAFGAAGGPTQAGTLAVALLLLADAWWLKVRRGVWRAMPFSWAAAWFAALGLVLAAHWLWERVPDGWEPSALALLAVACVASIYAVRLPEVVYLGQLVLGVAILAWLHRHGAITFDREAARPLAGPWWQPLPLALSALGLSHWWQRQRILPREKAPVESLHLLAAGALVLQSLAWLQLVFFGDAWLLALCVAAIVALFYGWATGAWGIVLCGQAFTFCAFGWLVWNRLFAPVPPPWSTVLLLAAVLLVSSQLLARAAGPTAALFAPAEAPTGFEPPFYWPAGLAILALWVHDYLPVSWHCFAYAGLSATLLAAAGALRHRPSGPGSLAFAFLTFLSFFFAAAHPPSLPELVAILLVAGCALATRRAANGLTSPRRTASLVLAALAAVSLWLWVTRWCYAHGHSRSLTVAWSAAALFVLAAGLALRERVWRLAGFLILALALGRIFVVDILALDTFYRILSCLTLGPVLLVIGYFYSRYADRIRRWL